MKSRYNRFHSAALLSTGFALSMCYSHAADQTWIDANASNNWNTTEPNWDAGATWTQSNNAIFGGTGETVTLTEAISLGNLTFGATGYTITGNTLALNGTTPILTTGTGIAATISSDVSGIFGLTKAGDGTLTFSNAKTYSGDTKVTGGKLAVSGSLRNSSAFNVTGSGSTLEFGASNILVANHGTAVAASRVITVNGGTMLMTSAVETRIGNVTLTNGGTFTSNRPLTSYDVLLADVSTGAATVAVTGTGMATMNGSGGIHLVGVQNFDVADTTGDSGTDLMVSMSLGAQGSQGGAAGGINKLGVGTMTVKGSGTLYNGATNVVDGTLVLTNTTAWGSAITLGAANTPKLQLDAPLSDDAWTFSKAITGSNTGAGVIKSGSGTVNISVSQNYTGNTAVNGGKLLLQGLFSSPPQAYRYYKLQVNSVQGGDGTLQLSELAFYTSGTNNTNGTRVIPVAYSGGGVWNAGANESPASAYDNNVNTKWCDNAKTFPQVVMFDFGSSILMSGYDWATGNDNTPNRNPKDWQVFGSNDNSTWTPIDAQVGQGATPTATKTYADGWKFGSPSLAPGGAVSVAASATFGGLGSAGAVTVAAGGNIQAGYAGAGTLTLGSLNFSGAGTVSGITGQAAAPLVVSGALTASGGSASVALAVPSLPAGTYHVIQYGSFGGSISNFTFPGPSRNMTLQNNAPYIDVVVTTPTVYPVWTGGANGGWNYAVASGNWKLSSDSSPTDFMLNDSVLFDDTVGSGNTNVTVSTESISAGTITFNNSTKDYTLTQANGKDITAGSLVKTGAGKLTVSGAFSYSGGSTLNGGIVSINNVGSLGTGGRTINGGTLEYTGATGTLPGSTTLGLSGGTIKVTDLAAVLTQAGSLTAGSSGSLIKDGPGTFVLPLATGTYANPIQITAGTLNLNYGTNAAVCSGTISGPATSILRLDGTGADANNGLTLTGNNTFTGETHIYGNRVFLNNPGGNAIGGDIVAKQGAYPIHGISLLRDEQIANTALLRFEGLSVRYDFRLNGHTETLAGIVCDNGFGRIANAGSDGATDTGAPAGTLIVSGPGDYSYNGNLLDQSGGTNGVLSFTKSGTGTQTLTGTLAQTGIIYTGATTVNSGTLKLLDATAFASNVTLNGGTLELSRSSGAWIFPKIIAAGSGAGNVKVTGSGIVTLTGASTYTGSTTIESGTLTVTGSIAGSPLIDVLVGGTLSSTTVGSGQTVRGTGTLAAVTFGNGSTLTPGTATAIDTIQGVGTITFQTGSTCAMQVDRTGGVITNDQLANMIGITYGGTLTVSATGQAFVNGNVIPLFPNATTYGGSFTTVNLPTLAAGLSWDLSGLTVDGSIKVVNYTATPVFNPPAGGYVGPQSVSISSDAGSTIYYTMNGSTPTLASPHALSPITNLAVPTNSSVTIKAFAKKAGQADSPLATAEYHTLDTPTWLTDFGGLWPDAANWQSGVVAQGIGVTADFSTLTLSGASSVALDGPRTVGRLIFGDLGDLNGWNLDPGTGGSLLLDNGANQPVVTVTNQSVSINAPTTSANGLLKNGAGTLALNEANAITGALTVSQGTLVANKSAALGAVTNTLVLGDAATGSGAPGLAIGTGITSAVTLASVSNSNFGTAQTITLNAGSTLNGNDAALVTTLNLTGTVPVTLKAANDGGHSTAQDVYWRIAGNGIPAGSTALILDGTVKALRLNQLSNTSTASSFSGDVLIKGAVTTQGRTYNGQTGAEHQNLTFLNNSVTVEAGGQWKVVWGGETAGTLNGAGNVNLDCQNALNNIGLTLGNNNASGTHSGVISGGFGLSKVGTGSQSLAGANTYSGATTVNAGTLSVDNATGSATGSGAVTVKTGGNLAGTGSISGATTIDVGSTVTAGSAGAGTLTLASVTLAGGIEAKLDTSTCGRLTVTGVLTIIPGATIHVSSINTPTAAEYIIASYASGSGSLPAVTGVPSGYTADTTTLGVVKLVKTAGSGFSAWADGFDGLTDKTPGGDPDRDGISNLMEYVIGGDPRVSSEQFLPKQTIVGPNLVISYKRRDDSESDTTLTGQWSTTLGSWTNILPVLVNENGSSPDDMTVTIPLSNAVDGKLFGRILVTQP